MLPEPLRVVPLAHRALHGPGRPENSMAAVRAAIAGGYGVEVDVRLSADGVAVVFHDEGLRRLTGREGRVADMTAAELAALPLLDGDGEGPPTLAQVALEIAGKVPLLVEIKPAKGDPAPLAAACTRVLAGYAGPVAIMSFDPAMVAAAARAAPDLPRGLVTWSWSGENSEALSPQARAHLRAIADFDRLGACFISHEAADLDRPRVAELAGAGVPVLCWTIRSAAEEARARRVACNITFEGYLPALPAT